MLQSAVEKRSDQRLLILRIYSSTAMFTVGNQAHGPPPLPEVIELMSTPPAREPDRSRITFIHPVDLPGVEILKAEDCKRLWRVYHTDYTVCTILRIDGVAEWRYRKQHYVSGGNSLMLLEPGEVHLNTCVTHAGPFYVLLLDPALIAAWAEGFGLGSTPHFKTPATDNAVLFDGFARFHAAQEAGASLLLRQTLLTRCVRMLFTRCCERPLCPVRQPGRAAIFRARDYLHEHWFENVTLDELARVAGVSRFHFLAAFEREFLLPPHAYQTSIRVEKVRLLLRAGVPAAEIEAGFADQSHLIRHFKRVWKVTPAQYAKMVGARKSSAGVKT